MLNNFKYQYMFCFENKNCTFEINNSLQEQQFTNTFVLLSKKLSQSFSKLKLQLLSFVSQVKTKKEGEKYAISFVSSSSKHFVFIKNNVIIT